MSTEIPPNPSFARAFALHVRSEFVDFWLSLISLAFIVLMPVMFYLGFGIAFLAQADEVRMLGDVAIRQADLSFASVLTFALISVTFANVAIGLAIRRQHGLFKRFRTTPVPPWVVMSAFLVNILFTLVIVVAVVALIGTLGLQVQVSPEQILPLAGVLALGFIAFAPLGVAFSLVPPSADAAVPIVNGVFFPLAFLSGAFVTLPLGDVVDAITHLLPGYPLMQLMLVPLSESGATWDPMHVIVLIGWGIVGTVLAAVFFRWASEREPRGFSRRRQPAE